MKTKSISGLKVKTGIKGAGLCHPNHNRPGLKVKAGLKAGLGILRGNHSRAALSVA